jgi:hypothetical protein
MTLKKTKRKVRRKRCQHCEDLVSPDEWAAGLCEDCMCEHNELLMIVEQYS